MFRFIGFCEDRNLAKVKRALASACAVDVTDQPMPETKAKNGKVESTKLEGFSHAASVVIKALKGQKTISTADASVALTAAGFSGNRVGNVLTGLVNAKVLKRTKVRGQYAVLK